jgi:hypothetical protein
LIRRTLDKGVTWETVDQQGTENGSAEDIVVSKSGEIFVSGSFDGNWVIRKSIDNGSSWTTVFSIAGRSESLTEDPATGNLFALGVIGSSTAQVRKSNNGGVSWNLIDSTVATNGQFAALTLSVQNSVLVYTGTDTNNTTHYMPNFCGNAGSTWFTRTSSNAGVSWATTENFKRVAGWATRGEGVAIDKQGSIITSGIYLDPSCKTVALTRKSIDKGLTFFDIDTPPIDSLSIYGYVTGKVFIDANDRIFSYGSRKTSLNFYEPLFRYSDDAGATWSEGVPNLLIPYSSTGEKVMTASNGDLLSVGALAYHLPTLDIPLQAYFRRSKDKGLTWVDETFLSKPAMTLSTARDIVEITSTNYLVIVSTGSKWQSYRTKDAGHTWNLVDDFLCAEGSGEPQAIAKDKLGNVFVVGYCYVQGFRSGVVRRSPDGGETWMTVDLNSNAVSTNIDYASISVDLNNQVVVLVNTTNASNEKNWLIRSSQDHGTTWVNSSVADAAVAHSLVITEANRYIVSSAKSLGLDNFWKINSSNDFGMTWTIIKNQAHPLEIKKTVLSISDEFMYLLVNDEKGSQIWSSINGNPMTKVDSILNEYYSSMTGNLCAVGSRKTDFENISVWSTRAVK